MVTLPHHVEYLSDGWIAEASAFIESFVQQRKFAEPFTLSERLTDAPPHLAGEDGSIAWTLSFDGKVVSTDRSFNPGAQIVREGDYQAALMFAQSVGVMSPGFLEAAQAAVAGWFGKDALRAAKESSSPRVNELLLNLHDHMGRRTVENPDVAHRATRQGLTRHVREMEEQGYTVIERAITPSFADEVRAATLRTLLPHQGSSLQWMLYHGIEFEQIVQNPFLMTLIDISLGRGAVIASISSIKRGPGPGSIPLHNDYSQVPEPYPEFSMTGVGVWALEDWTAASGPTWLVPGSHKLRRGPRPGEQAEGIPIEMPKGSVVYFHHAVWHWQGDRTEPGDRVTLHSHFNRGILRSLEPKRVDVQMMHRNPPRLGEMLGEDDWYDKLTAAGRDHLRMGYMHKLHAMTDEGKRKILAEAS